MLAHDDSNDDRNDMAAINQLVQQGPSKGDMCKGLAKLRQSVLRHGVPAALDGMSDTRIYVWLIFLDAAPLPTDRYLDLVRQGPSPMYEKIRNDTFRTLATDPLFRRRVTENSLTRVLNAVSWQLHDAHEARVNGWQSPPSIGVHPPLSFSGSPDGQGESPAALRFGRELESDAGGSTAPSQETSVGYVQGMNVLAAPFLYAARSEVQAFAAYSHFITTICPGYVRGGSMEGVHRGLTLIDKVLELVDPKLSSHLQSRHLTASIYGFASVLTLCACTPPLPEVLKLWDFLFAFGPHLNLVCIVAQLIMIRDKLLSSDSPNQILRAMPPLDADQIKAVSISLIRHIPGSLFEEIISHAT